MKLSGTYSVIKWDEKPYRPDENGRRSTRTSAEFAFAGDITGTAFVEYLMFYSFFNESDMHKSQAQYVGQIKVVGDIKGKCGSFVLSDTGSFDAGVATSEVDIISGSGTGELISIIGLGSYQADQNGCHWEMDVQL
jgi:hypothetical protein